MTSKCYNDVELFEFAYTLQKCCETGEQNLNALTNDLKAFLNSLCKQTTLDKEAISKDKSRSCLRKVCRK